VVETITYACPVEFGIVTICLAGVEFDKTEIVAHVASMQTYLEYVGVRRDHE
jgi:hypothetical protein